MNWTKSKTDSVSTEAITIKDENNDQDPSLSLSLSDYKGAVAVVNPLNESLKEMMLHVGDILSTFAEGKRLGVEFFVSLAPQNSLDAIYSEWENFDHICDRVQILISRTREVIYRDMEKRDNERQNKENQYKEYENQEIQNQEIQNQEIQDQEIQDREQDTERKDKEDKEESDNLQIQETDLQNEEDVQFICDIDWAIGIDPDDQIDMNV